MNGANDSPPLGEQASPCPQRADSISQTWATGPELLALLEGSNGGFPGGSVVENPPANAGDAGSIPGSGRSPGEENGNPLQYSCLGKSHGLRSLPGSSVHGDSPGKNTEVGCHFLLQGIFLTQESNPGLLRCNNTLLCVKSAFFGCAGSWLPCAGPSLWHAGSLVQPVGS